MNSSDIIVFQSYLSNSWCAWFFGFGSLLLGVQLGSSSWLIRVLNEPHLIVNLFSWVHCEIYSPNSVKIITCSSNNWRSNMHFVFGLDQSFQFKNVTKWSLFVNGVFFTVESVNILYVILVQLENSQVSIMSAWDFLFTWV